MPRLDPMLIFRSLAISGLANQLRGLTSAMLLAEDLGREFALAWTSPKDMAGVEFSDVFELPAFPRWENPDRVVSRFSAYGSTYTNRQVLGLWKRLQYQLFKHHQFNNIGCDMVATGIKTSADPITLSSYYSFSIEKTSDQDFYARRHRVYQEFSPIPQIRDEIERFWGENFNDNTIGLHLRTGKSLRDESGGTPDAYLYFPDGVPFSDIFSFIDAEISTNPDTRIFLATDNVAEASPLLDRYREISFVYPKSTTDGMVSRASLQDQRDALVDLYLLSRTRKMIGTENSSFSYEAAVLGDVPFFEIGPDALRQVHDFGNDFSAIIDFRDRVIRNLEYRWKSHDRKRSARIQADSVESRARWLLVQELKRQDAPTVIDLGAETGSVSLLARHLPQSRFYSCEGDRRNFELLRSNVLLNHLENRVHTFGHIPESIDQLTQERKIDRVSLIRIRADLDIRQIIGGARDTIARFRPVIFIDSGSQRLRKVEVWEALLKDALESLSYSVALSEDSNLLMLRFKG